VGALVLAFMMIMVGLIIALPATTAASSGDMEWTGLVLTRPTGVTGTWVVGGMSFEATSSTQLEEEHGPLDVGACARVRYEVSSGVNVASTISSQEAYKCGTGDGDHGEHMKVYSYVNALPAGFPITLTGEWVIGNVTYTAVITTHFEQEDGAFAVGQCVGVEYISDTNRLALDIETAQAFKCTGGGGVPHAVVHGVVDSFPAGLVGTWTVSGTVYTATADTRFEQEEGPFFVGGCVQVRFNPTNNVAFAISTEEAWKCGGLEPAERKFFGVISSIPTGTLGTWVIGGNSFVVTTTTELEQEHGLLAVGACAGVEYVVSGTDNLAKEISSEEMFKCGTGTFTNVSIGRISSFPPGLYGTWVITRNGGFTDTFEADTSTEFDQEHGSFAPGVCVKVKYFTQSGVNHAVEIGTLDAEDCGGAVPPLPGMNIVFATIDQFPTGTPPIGLWIIGGAQYSATSETHFVQNHGPFAVGACVKALYSVVSDTNVLHQVETKDAHKCEISGAQVFRSFGVIESFPADLIGEWNIGGISYTAGATTTFEQEHGFFAVGAFVEVRYILSGTTRFALSIETHVAPGAGRDNVIGVLQAHDMSDDWSPWVVNGVTYQSDPAINVQESGQMMLMGQGPGVAVGQLVHLNFYRSADGTPYATSVTPVHQVFLPIAFR
jgi:hypothetical protein